MDEIYDLILHLCEDHVASYKENNDIEEEEELEDFEIEDILFECFGIQIDDFNNLIKLLIPLCSLDKSPNGKLYQGFATNKSWLIKEEVK